MQIIKRRLFEELKNHLENKEISLIIGPRQVGKTTLMQSLKKYLELLEKKTIFLNLDYEEDKKFFTTQENLLKK